MPKLGFSDGLGGGGVVCVGEGGSIRQHEHFYEIGPL